jgi:hypothetical protein
VVRPSEDVGRIAATRYRERGGSAGMDLLPSRIIRAALRGVPTDEADLLSYLYFDRCYTRLLVELGRDRQIGQLAPSPFGDLSEY